LEDVTDKVVQIPSIRRNFHVALWKIGNKSFSEWRLRCNSCYRVFTEQSVPGHCNGNEIWS